MIDYSLISDSIDFYELRGFKRVESPWLVTEAISSITKPEWAESHFVSKGKRKKVFVGSGEQSFLYMINKGFLPAGSYQTVTPCLRNDEFDAYHTKYFIKNELILFGDNVSEKNIDDVLDKAYCFFRENISPIHRKKLNVIPTPIGFDIELDGIELGSYGYRECQFTKWIYGTGCAEPRFSRVLRNL